MNTWQIQEKRWDITQYPKYETLFSLSNGYMGVRGSFEEGGVDSGHDGFYLNGFYETYPLSYGETFPGYPSASQAMVNLPNPKKLVVEIDGQELSLQRNNPSEFERILDMKTALLNRKAECRMSDGKTIRIESERFVSAVREDLCCMHFKITAVDKNCRIKLASGYDLKSRNLSKEDDPRIGVEFSDTPLIELHTGRTGNTISLKGKIRHSGLAFSSLINHNLKSTGELRETALDDENFSGLSWETELEAGEALTLYKYIWYRKDETACYEELDSQLKNSYETLKQEHCSWWADAWRNMDICIDGDEKMQQGIRFSMFHLLQSVGKDGRTNIAAKGMTGEGYEGHYFWDTEIYMIPFFTFTNPAVARKLLEYRYGILDTAKNRAKEMGHTRGALFPWRTISGPECSSYFPAGTAQYHISSDVAHAVKVYWEGTGDREFLLNQGLELLVETNRLWADMAVFDADEEHYAIQNVTGPDEYTALVDNNFYTNRMIKDQLGFFADILNDFGKLADSDPSRITLNNTLNRLEVEENELTLWDDIYSRIYLPYDERKGITPQDDRFLQKPVWDIENTPRSQFPLLMHYHPLVLYRYQVCKQPDVVLAQFLLSGSFSMEQKIRDYEYYEKITTHDSSLSPCIYGCMASEIGRLKESYNFYVKTARTDLDDFHGNVKDGVHAANMAGSWIGLTYGFARMRHWDGMMSFSPLLPDAWQSYSFRIHCGSSLLSVKVGPGETEYTVLEGEGLRIEHYGKEYTVNSIPLKIATPAT